MSILDPILDDGYVYNEQSRLDLDSAYNKKQREYSFAGDDKRKALMADLDYNKDISDRLLGFHEDLDKGDSGEQWIAREGLRAYKVFLRSPRTAGNAAAYKKTIEGLNVGYKKHRELFKSLTEGLTNEADLETYAPKSNVDKRMAAEEGMNWGGYESKDNPDYYEPKQSQRDDFYDRVEKPEFDQLFPPREKDADGNLLKRNPEDVDKLWKEWEASSNTARAMDDAPEDEPKVVVNEFTGAAVGNLKFTMSDDDHMKAHVSDMVKSGGMTQDTADKFLKDSISLRDKMEEANFADTSKVSDNGKVTDERGRDQAKLFGDHEATSGSRMTDAYMDWASKKIPLDALAPSSLTSEYDVKAAGGASFKEIQDTWGLITPAYRAGSRKIVSEQGWVAATLSKGGKKIHQNYMDIGYGLGGITGLVDDETIRFEYEARAQRATIENLNGGNDFIAEVIGVAPSLAFSIGGGAVLSKAGALTGRALASSIAAAASKTGVAKGLTGAALRKHITKQLVSKTIENSIKGRLGGALSWAGKQAAARGGNIAGSAFAGGIESGAKTYASMTAEKNEDGSYRYSEEERMAGARRAFITTSAVTLLYGGSGSQAIFKKKMTSNAWKADMVKHGFIKRAWNQFFKPVFAGGREMGMEAVEEFTDEFLQAIWQGNVDGEFFNKDGSVNVEFVRESFDNALHAGKVGFFAGGLGAPASTARSHKKANDAYTKAFMEQRDNTTLNKAQYTPEMRKRLESVVDTDYTHLTAEAASEAIHASLEESRLEVAKAAGIAPEGIEGTELALRQARAQHSADEAIEQAERKAFEDNPDFESSKVYDDMSPEAQANIPASAQKARRMIEYATNNSTASKKRLNEAEAAHVAAKTKVKEEAKAAKAEAKATKVKVGASKTADEKPAVKVDGSKVSTSKVEKTVDEIADKVPVRSERSPDNTAAKKKVATEQKVRKMVDSKGKKTNLHLTESEREANEALKGHENTNSGTKLWKKILTIKDRVLPQYGTGKTRDKSPMSKGEAIGLLNEAKKDLHTISMREGKSALSDDAKASLKTQIDNIQNIIDDMYDGDGGGTIDMISKEKRGAFREHVAGLNRASSVEHDTRDMSTPVKKKSEEPKPQPKKKTESRNDEKAPEPVKPDNESSGTRPKGEEYSPEQFYKGDKVTFYDRRGVAQHGTFISHGESRGFKYATIKVGLDSENVNSRVFMRKDGSYDMVHGTNPADKWGGKSHIEELERKAPFKYPPVNGYDTEQEYRDAKKKYADDVTAWVKVELAKGPSEATPKKKAEISDEGTVMIDGKPVVIPALIKPPKAPKATPEPFSPEVEPSPEELFTEPTEEAESGNATGNEGVPDISKMRPDTKETIKELRGRGMEGAAKGHESLDSAEADLSKKFKDLAKKVGRDGEIAEKANDIFKKMDTKGMTEDQLHQARHQSWAEAIAAENNPDLNDVMAAHQEIADGFASDLIKEKESFDEKRRRIQAQIDRKFAIENRLMPIINAVAAGKSVQEAVAGAYTGSYSIEGMTTRTYSVHDSLAFATSFARAIADSEVSTDVTFDEKLYDLTKLSGEQLYKLYSDKMKSLKEAPKVDDAELNSLIGFITYQQAIIDIKLNSKQLDSTDLHQDLREQLDSPLNDIGRIDKAADILEEINSVNTATEAGRIKANKLTVGLIKLITTKPLGIGVEMKTGLKSDSRFKVIKGEKKIHYRKSLFNKIHKRKGGKKLTKSQKQANAYEALRILEHEVLHVAAYDAVGVESLALLGERVLSSPQMMSRIQEYGDKKSDVDYFKNLVKLDSEGNLVSALAERKATVGKGAESNQEGLARLGFEAMALMGQEIRTGTHSSRSLAASHELNAAQGIIAPVFDAIAKAKRDLLHVSKRVTKAINEKLTAKEADNVVEVEFEQNQPADGDEDVFAPNMAQDILTDLDVKIVEELRNIDAHMNVKFGWKPVLAEHLGINESEGTVAGVSILGTFDQRADNPLAAASDAFLSAIPHQDGDSVAQLKELHRQNSEIWEKGDKRDIAFLAQARLVNASLVDFQDNLNKYIDTKDGVTSYTAEGMAWMSDYSQKQNNLAKLAAKNNSTLTDNGKAFNKVLAKKQKRAQGLFKRVFGREAAKGSDYKAPDSKEVIDNADENLMAAVALVKEANQFVVRTVGGKGRMNITLARYNTITHKFELNYNPELLPRDTDGKLIRTSKGLAMPSLSDLNSAINELNETGYIDGIHNDFTDSRAGFDDSATDLHNAILSELSDDAFVEAAFDVLWMQSRPDVLEQIRAKTAPDGPPPAELSKTPIDEKRTILKNLLGDTSESSFFKGMNGDQISNRIAGLPDFDGKVAFEKAHNYFLDSVKAMAELESLLTGINANEEYDPDADVRNRDFTAEYNPYAGDKSPITKEIGVIAPLLDSGALRKGLLGKNLETGVLHLEVSQGHALMAERALDYINEGHLSEMEESKRTRIVSGLKALQAKAEVDAQAASENGVDVLSAQQLVDYKTTIDKASEADLKDFMNLFTANGAYDIKGQMFIVEGEAHDSSTYDKTTPEWRAFRGQYTNPLVGKLQADIQAVYDDEALPELDQVHLERGDILYLVLGEENLGTQDFQKRSNVSPLIPLALASAIGTSGRDVSDIGRRIPLPVAITEENRSMFEFNQDYLPRLRKLFDTLNSKLEDKKMVEGEFRDDAYAYKLQQTPLFSYQEDVLQKIDNLQAHIDKYGIKPEHFNEEGSPVMLDDDNSQMEVDYREMFTEDEETFSLKEVVLEYKNKISNLQYAVIKMNQGIDLGVAPLMRYSKPFTMLEKLNDYKNGREVLSGGIENAMKQVERMVPKLADPNYNLRGRHVRSPEAFEDELSSAPIPIEYDENGLSIGPKWDDFEAGETPSARRERGKDPKASMTKEEGIYSAYDVNESVDLDKTGYGLGEEESAEHEKNQKQRAIHYMYSFLYTDGDAAYNLDAAVDVLNKMMFDKYSYKRLTGGSRDVEGVDSPLTQSEFESMVPKYNIETMMEADSDLLMSAMHEVMLDALNKNRVLRNAQKIATIANMTGTTEIFGANGSGTVYSSDWGTVHDDALSDPSDNTLGFDSYVETLEKHAKVLRDQNSQDKVPTEKILSAVERGKTKDFNNSDALTISSSSLAHREVGKALVDMGFGRGHPIHNAATNSAPMNQSEINSLLFDAPDVDRAIIESLGNMIMASNQSAQLFYKTALELRVANDAINDLKNVSIRGRKAFGRHLEVRAAVEDKMSDADQKHQDAVQEEESNDLEYGLSKGKTKTDDGKPVLIKGRPAVNEFYDLMANAALLPEGDVKIITAGQMLNNNILTGAGGTVRGLSVLSKLMSGGLSDVPVIVHNGAKAPEHLRYANTSGVIVDDAGDVTGMFLNLDPSMGQAGLSTGIESIVHDLAEIQLSKNLDSMVDNQKKKIKTLKTKLDEQYLAKAREDYVDRGVELFEGLIKKKGKKVGDGVYEVFSMNLEPIPEKGKHPSEWKTAQEPIEGDFKTEAAYKKAVKAFEAEHGKTYTVDLNDSFVRIPLRAEIGRLHDMALPLNSKRLLDLTGENLATPLNETTFTKAFVNNGLTDTKVVLPAPDFINTRGLTDVELSGIIDGNNVVLRKGKKASDVEGLVITGNPEMPVKLLYKEGNKKVIKLQGSRPVILINLKEDVTIKKMLLARHPDTKIEDIPLVGEDLVEAISIRSSQAKGRWRDRVSRANLKSEYRYANSNFKKKVVAGEVGTAFQNMSDVEFFSKVLFDTKTQMYLDLVSNFPEFDYISRKLTKSLSEEELAAAEVIKSDLSHHEEVGVLDPTDTRYVPSTTDLSEKATDDNYNDLDTTEGNDKKSALKAKTTDKVNAPVLINNEMAAALGRDASIFDSLIKIGVGLVSKNASVASHNLDQIRPAGSLPSRGIHSAVKLANNKSAPITIDDILDGRADDIVKADRMRQGRLGAYSDALMNGQETNNEYFRVIVNGRKRTEVNGEILEALTPEESKLLFLKGELFVKVEDPFSDKESTMLILPYHDVMSKADYKKADDLLAADKKRFLDKKAFDQGHINDEIKDTRLALKLTGDNDISLREAYDLEQNKDIIDAKKLRDARAFLDENENKSKALQYQLQVLKNRGVNLDNSDFTTEMRDNYAKMYYEERIRHDRSKRRNDPKYDPNNSPDIRRDSFVEGDPLFNYLRDQSARGFDFVESLDDVLAGRKFLRGDTYSHRPILDVNAHIKELRRSQYGMSDKEASNQDAVDDRGFSDPTYKQDTKPRAKDFAVHSGNDSQESSSLLTEFGMERDEVLSSEMRERTLIGLEGKNDNYSQLSPESPVRASVEGMIGIVADFAASIKDADKGTSFASDADFATAIDLLSKAEIGDLHGFMKDGAYFVSKAMGTFFMSESTTGVNYKYKKLHGQLSMHRDAKLKAFMAKDRPLYEMMVGVLDILEQGLGSKGGRNKAHVANMAADLRIKKAIKKAGHKKANEAYTAKLLTRVVPDLVVRTTLENGDVEVVEMSIRDQLLNNIAHVEAGYKYDEVKHEADVKHLTEFTGFVPALLEKAKAYVATATDEQLEGFKGGVTGYETHMQEGLTADAMAAVQEVQDVLAEMETDTKVLGEALGENENSFINLNRNTKNFVPHLTVGSSLGGKVDHAEKPMYKTLGGAVGRVFGGANHVTALNFNLLSAGMSEVTKKQNLNSSAVEYQVIDNLFGYSEKSEDQFITGMEAGADSTGDPIRQSSAKAISNFGQALMRKQKVNDTRPAYVRGFFNRWFAKDAVIGYFMALTSPMQFVIQVGTGLVGQTVRNPMDTVKMVHNMGRMSFTPFERADGGDLKSFYNKGEGFKKNMNNLFGGKARADMRIMKERGGAWFIDRGFNGVEQYQRGVETLNSEDYTKIGLAVKAGGIVMSGLPKTLLSVFVGLPDAAILSGIYATQLQSLTGKSIAELAADPTGYTKEIGMARINTESIMAQSDLSKKADVFQPAENDALEAVRLTFIPFGNQKLSMAADTAAYIKILNPLSKATKGARKEAARGLVSNISQQVAYNAIKIKSAMFLASSLGAVIAEAFDDEDKEKVSDRQKRYQKYLYSVLSGDKPFYEGGFGLWDQLAVVHKDDTQYDLADWAGKMIHGSILEGASLIHPALSLDPSTNTLAVGMQYGSDALAENTDWGKELSKEMQYGRVDGGDGKGRTMNPRGRRFIDRIQVDGKSVQQRKGLAHAVVDNAFSGAGAVHGLMPSLVDVYYRRLSATQDYQSDALQIEELTSHFLGTRERRANIKKDLNKRMFGKTYKPDSATPLSGDGVPWHKSGKRADAPARITAPVDQTPEMVFDTESTVFGNGNGYHKEVKSYKYNGLVDGDSGTYTSSQTFPLSYTSYRIFGADTNEKVYKRNHQGRSHYKRHYEEHGLNEYASAMLGEEAAHHKDQLLHGKNITFYVKKGKRGSDLRGRTPAFAMIPVDGKNVDFGIYLASKGLAMMRRYPKGHEKEGQVRKNIFNNIPAVLPSGKSRSDYVKAFYEAEKYAERNGFGMYYYGSRKKHTDLREATEKARTAEPNLMGYGE